MWCARIAKFWDSIRPASPNDGRFVAFVAPGDAALALAILRPHEVTGVAAIIGRVRAEAPRQVSSCGPFGVERVIDMLNGERGAGSASRVGTT